MSENPYQATEYSYPSVTADMATADARATFIKRTYLHLLGAVLACIAIDAVILNVFDEQLKALVPMFYSGWNPLIALGAFMAVSYVADRWAHSNVSRSMQYLGLGTYIVAEALFLIPLLYIAEKFASPGIIESAGMVTAFVFGGLTITVLVTKADFSFLRFAIVTGTFIAFAVMLIPLALPGFNLGSMGLWFSVAMVVLASGIILYNTSKVLHDYGTEQYVAASLTLFASVALLFWYVLQIFMVMDD